MSIVTKTGDDGTTALMFGRRVPKHHARIEACGTIDELNAAIGLARATSKKKFPGENLLRIQGELITLMGEIAVTVEDLPRYAKEGFPAITPAMTARLVETIKKIEAQKITFKGWATPGATAGAAALDLARTICRRAERRVCVLLEKGELKNTEIVIYLNRLADLLWLFARWSESSTHRRVRKK